jgi:hypothetical protein
MKLKKLNLLLLLAVAFLLVVTGCKSSNNGSGGNSNGVSFKVVDKKMFVNNESDNSKKYVGIKVKLKNTSKDSLSFSDDDFGLKDSKGNTKSPENGYFDDLNDSVSKLDYGKISDGESKTGWIFFNVKPTKKYTLTYKGTLIGDDNTDDVKLSKPVDLSLVKDESNDVNTAAKAYIDAVFFDGSSKEYKKYISNDLDVERAKVYKETTNKIFEAGGLENTEQSAKANAAIAQIYQKGNAEKTKIKTKVKVLTGNAAMVNISGYTMNLNDIFENYELNTDENGQVDPKEFLTGMLESMDSHDVKKISSTYLDLTLKKDGSRWKVVDSGDTYNRIVDAFDGTGY